MHSFLLSIMLLGTCFRLFSMESSITVKIVNKCDVPQECVCLPVIQNGHSDSSSDCFCMKKAFLNVYDMHKNILADNIELGEERIINVSHICWGYNRYDISERLPIVIEGIIIKLFAFKAGIGKNAVAASFEFEGIPQESHIKVKGMQIYSHELRSNMYNVFCLTE